MGRTRHPRTLVQGFERSPCVRQKAGSQGREGNALINDMGPPTVGAMASEYVIRIARADDAAALAAIYSPYVASAPTSFETEAPSADEMARRCALIQASLPWLVCEIDGAVCGYAYASRHHERSAYQWSCDSAVYVAAAWHRRSVGRALYTVLFGLLRLQGYCAVHAGITLPNPASQGLHEALGFRPVGVYPLVGYKLGAWHDVGYWQLELLERIHEPPALVGLTQVLSERSEEAAAAFAAGEGVLAQSR